MEKKNFIFAEAEEEYLYSIVNKFVQELGNAIAIEIITEESYLQQISSAPIRCDVLIVGEEWYCKYFNRQNISNVFLLCENREAEGEAGIKRIYKYSSVKEIYLKVFSNLNLERDMVAGKDTLIYAVHSAVGGCGKTTFSMGLCTALKKYSNRVLYLNLESIQNFNYLLDDKEYLEYSRWCREIKNGLEYIARNQGIDYIPPFRQSGAACNLSYSMLLEELEETRNRGFYDYIVVELPLDMDGERLQFLNRADKMIFLTGQDELSLWKTERFLENIDASYEGSFLVVCNCFCDKDENFMEKSSVRCDANIPRLESTECLQGIAQMAETSLWEELVYLLL